MNTLKIVVLSPIIAGMMGGCAATSSTTHSGDYAGQQARAIKSLSGDEIASLLEGRGMGYAKAAELNSYPGPMHVLEHAKALALSAEQETATRNLMAMHKAQARHLGKELVDSERDLNQLFAARSIDVAALERQLGVIATRQAAVRGSHLRTHLAQTALMTTAQIEKYTEIRGYQARRPHETSMYD